jgi:hypothetical protein
VRSSTISGGETTTMTTIPLMKRWIDRSDEEILRRLQPQDSHEFALLEKLGLSSSEIA